MTQEGGGRVLFGKLLMNNHTELALSSFKLTDVSAETRSAQQTGSHESLRIPPTWIFATQ